MARSRRLRQGFLLALLLGGMGGPMAAVGAEPGRSWAAPGIPPGFRVEPPARAFADVPDEHWARDAIDWLRQEGVLEGWSQGFHGADPFTRYEMAQVLARYLERLLTERDRLRAQLVGAGGPSAAPDRSPAPSSLDQHELVRVRSELENVKAALARIAGTVAVHRAMLEPGAPEQDPLRRQVLHALEEVSAGRLEVDRAQVIGYLASVAEKLRKLHGAGSPEAPWPDRAAY